MFSAKNIVLLTEINGFFDASLLHNYMDVIEKYPEILINKLVNYIYIVGFDNKIHFLGNDEKLLIELGDISKKAGINSKYKANFTDKSQFYSYSEKVPIR